QYDLDGPLTIVLNKLDVLLAGGGLTVKEPVTIALGDELKISDFAINFKPGGRLAGEVDLTPGRMVIAAKGDKIPFKAFKPFAGADLPDGELQSLDLALSQGTAGLTGSLTLKTSATVQKFKPVVTLNGDLKGGGRPSFELEGKIDGGPGWKADGDFKASVPLFAAEGGFPQPDMNGAIDGEIKFTGSLGPLWQLAGQPDRSLKGLARLEAKIGGTLNKPVPTGTLYVAGGRYEDSILGVLINDITVEARSTRELPLKALLSAKDGKGGGLALEASVKNLDNPTLSAKGRMSRFSPTHRDDLVVYVSGDFGAEGPLDKLSLTSDLTVDHGELDLKIAAAAGSVPTLPISGADDKVVETSKGMRANLKINIPGRFFIRGSGLESEWRGKLTVGGFTSRPSLVGQLAPVRGYFTFAAKEFEFSGGDISFSGGTVPNLNLELTNNTPGLTAILRFGGNATKPTLTMESRPPYPEEEVLSHVLFGKSASTISRFEALQLASALNGLRNFGSDGFNALDTVRASLGLDVLRLGGANDDRERRASGMSGSMAQDMTGGGSSADGEQSDDITVEAGKYIADNVYVGVEHSGVGGPAVRLEVELRPSVSLEARTSTESSRIGLGWKKDY
ncbi:translocation/assembly module TamB domain-containing protein, partial [Deltaproteobacteria bacterium OttesenSCG-928-K17]|nr:translocation/assembly module TamB domain-containing protein [Deltaproteobacteria bacterium OttesenSCG-928-K17]